LWITCEENGDIFGSNQYEIHLVPRMFYVYCPASLPARIQIHSLLNAS
jgi:hypothetical protein